LYASNDQTATDVTHDDTSDEALDKDLNGTAPPDPSAPGSAKADYAAPNDAAPTTHTVKRGDNLSRIAKEVYGDAEMWPLIAAANGIERPDMIQPGQTLTLPPKDDFDAAKVHKVAGEFYAVKEEARQAQQDAMVGNITPPTPSATAGPAKPAEPDALAESRADAREFYEQAKENAVREGNPLKYIAAHFGELAADSGYNLAEAGRGLYRLATNEQTQQQALRTAAYLADHPEVLADMAVTAGKDFWNKPFEEKAEAIFKFGLEGLATAGVTKVAAAAGDVAISATSKVGQVLAQEASGLEKLGAAAAGTLGREGESALVTADRLAKEARVTTEFLEGKVMRVHGPQSTIANKSLFSEGFDIKAGIETTLRSPETLFLPNTQGRAGTILIRDFGQSIGTTSRGAEVTRLKVVMDQFGKLVTAYPVK
jgi:LysM repeat protein